MDGKYWDNFAATGKIEEYLRYRQQKEDEGKKGGRSELGSDSGNRNGAPDSADRRIGQADRAPDERKGQDLCFCERGKTPEQCSGSRSQSLRVRRIYFI